MPLPAVRFLASRCYPCSQCVSLPAGATLARSCFPMALRPGAPFSSTSSVLRLLLSIGALLATCTSVPRLLLPINALAGNLHMGALAVAPIGAPAGNKPHQAEKRTPVWLAIWAFVRSGAFFSLHLYHTTSFLSGLSRIIAFINICIFGHLQSYECFFLSLKTGN